MLVARPKRQQRQMSKLSSSDDNLPPSPFNTIDLNSAKPKTKNSRQGKPKTRTGCITCKIRRVKCDEGKPFCHRCIKFGSKQYATAISSKTSAPTRRGILPKGTPIVPRIHHVPAGPRFDDEYESRFFRLYVHETATQIAGPFKTSLWSRLIPQACEAEPFIRQIVVGIGALSEVCKTEARTGTFNSHKRKTYEYALKQYDKALRGMRNAIAQRNHDIRNALIACLLVFCFESLQGDPTSAAKNARSGLVLLQEYMTERFVFRPDFDFLAVQQGKLGSFYGLETDLLHAFAALDIQVLFYVDTRTESQHLAFVEQFLLAIRNRMPESFDSLQKCRNFWILIQRRNYHFNIIAIDMLSKPGAKAPDGVQEMNGRKLDEWGADNLPKERLANSSEDTRSALSVQMESYREDIRRWSCASATVFAHLEQFGTQEEKVIMKLMQIHAHLNHVQLAAAFMASDLEYDDFLPEYTAIVDLSEEVYPYLASSGVRSNQNPDQVPNSNPRFNDGGLFRFDLGIVYPLASVGFRCRNSSVRDHAINLLNRSSYREGIWDSLTVGYLTDWIRRVEEEGMDANGFIPEDKRAVMTLCDVDLKNKSVNLGCTSKGPNGERKFRMERMEWRFLVGEEGKVLKLGEDKRYLAKFRE